MKQAAIYIRVSTEEQTEFSPDAQKRALMDYADKNGMVTSNQYVYIDAGISGRKAEKRPAFMRMIAEAKQKPRPFDVILVHKFDRFARNREDSIVYKSMLRRDCGIQVISITEHMEEDKFSVILEAMLEAMAEYYSLNLADEVRKGQKEKARRGGYLGRPPYGYHYIDGNVHIYEPEAEIVKRIFKLYDGGKGVHVIARMLDAEGVKSKSGKKWGNGESIYTLFGNEMYKGYVKTKFADEEEPMIVKGLHEPIISEELFDRVHALYQKRRFKMPKQDVSSWAAGIVRCSKCGHAISSRGVRYMQCCGYPNHCDTPNGISKKKAEQMIIDELDKLKSSSDLVFASNTNDIEKGNKDIDLKIKRLESSIQRAREAYLSGIDTIDVYKNTKTKLEAEIKALEESKKVKTEAEATNRRTINVSTLGDLLKNGILTTEEKSIGLRSIVDRIVYDKETQHMDIIFKDVGISD